GHVDLPKYYGVMGLVEDGKGYFQNNLHTVSEFSGYSIEEIKNDPRINILAYAAAYAEMQKTQATTSRSLETQGEVITSLSELPSDRDVITQYAKDQLFYSILKEVENKKIKAGERSVFNYNSIFGAERAKLLQASEVSLTTDRSLDGDRSADKNAASCTGTKSGPDQAGAIWTAAHSKNFGIGRKGQEIDLIVIHTTQGPYHGAINWFRNPQARVSAHYVIRSFDGQITQMVCEKDRGFHAGGEDNLISVGIEHEGWVEEGTNWYTDAMYEASAKVVRDVCKRYNINPLKMYSGKGTNTSIDLSNKCRKIKGHQHLPSNQNGHIDPGKDWDWDKYYKLVNGEMPAKVNEYTAVSGTIYDTGGASGNYGVQERIGYLIQPAGATSISIEVNELDLEGTNAKPYDYLDIFEGENSDGKLLARLCGKVPPAKPIVAKGGAIYMEFRSDCADVMKGWKISYSANAKAPTLAPPSEVNVSNLYPMGAKLSWKRGAGSAQTIVNLRRSIDDKWTTFATGNSSLQLTGLPSNSKYLYQILSISGKDSSESKKGSFTTPQISRLEAPKAYSVTATEGRFTDSGGLMNPYSYKEDYTFTIAPSTGGKVTLSFSSFETEATDILYVYDGADTKGKLLGQLSGDKIPKDITSSKGAMTIRFKSDAKVHKKGWNAEWKTAGSGSPITPPTNPNPTTPPKTEDPDPTPTPTPPSPTASWEIQLPYTKISPTSTPVLEASYSKDATLSFTDSDKSGKGWAQRFLLITENTGKGWRGNKDKGFFAEDFNKVLSADWKSVKGTWAANDGLLVQKDEKQANSNFYAKVNQTKGVYLYQWQAKMGGSTDNKRTGFHFFCNDVEKENRGASYFIWARDAASGDKIEIYKVSAADKFEQKAVANATFENGKSYDFKTVYDANTGKIEVFINNQSAVSWIDSSPILAGKAISLRTANCSAEFDNVMVYKGRSATVNVTVGADPSKDFRVISTDGKTPTVKVESIVLDKAGHWSLPKAATTRITGAKTTTPPPAVGSRDTESYSDDFVLNLIKQEHVINSFYLVSEFDGKRWNANADAGCLSEDFAGAKMKNGWFSEGKWTFVEGTVKQNDAVAKNTTLSIPVKQTQEDVFLYTFRFKLNSKGDNKRLGLYLFAEESGGLNRGNSYLVWFRNNDTQADQVELYRSIDGKLSEQKVEKPAKIQSGQWHDVKIVLEPQEGKFAVWLDGKKVAYMNDEAAAFETGNFISFRTAECQAQFDDLRVYRVARGNDNITVGKEKTDMIRTSKGKIQFMNCEKPEKWVEGETKVVTIKAE
ncbi:MAG: CUB domain-containing protein, partial [Bacteroidia bacterium]